MSIKKRKETFLQTTIQTRQRISVKKKGGREPGKEQMGVRKEIVFKVEREAASRFKEKLEE